MAAELRLTKIVPSEGDDIDVEGNLVVGTDLVPKAFEVKGNLNAGSDIIGSGDLDIGGDIIADNISVRDTPTLDDHLITKGYLESTEGMPEGYLYGYEISNGSTPDSEIDIQPGTCKDSTNIRAITLSAGTTIDITLSGAGGLDTGTVANDTWYYIWAIYSTSTGTTDVMFSASKTSPTLPSGYDYKRRIKGAVLTDGTADIIPFNQKDNYFWFAGRQLDIDIGLNALPTSKTAYTISAPPNFKTLINARWEVGSNPYYVSIMGANENDPTVGVNDCDMRITTEGASSELNKILVVNSSSQLYLKAAAVINTTFKISTIGFWDYAQD